MSDYSQFKKLFEDQGVSFVAEAVMTTEAQELARMCAEPLAAKTSRYIMVGNTYFHFDYKGQFVGIESQMFEPSEKMIKEAKHEESKDTGTGQAAQGEGEQPVAGGVPGVAEGGEPGDL